MLNHLPQGCTIIRTLYQGAEAIVTLCEWMDMKVVVKTRVRKGYRIRELDEYIRRSRTIREASLLSLAKRAGVETPFIYHINPAEGWIIMSYVEGENLRNLQRSSIFPHLINRLGYIVGRLHSIGIVHGDLTPANVIVSNDRLTLIDFGLGEYSNEVEKKAEDIYTLVSSLSPLPNNEALVKLFLEGYKSSAGESAIKVEERIKEISKRGRYVEKELRH
ncbi:MAG: KEOPS complex kinase/ATPase Bud32 [Crenarchaeota archaeon]|nr:KEOPS complex kinase/ATPase Bud32 [Thermoproteota archaeon]MDW8033706.1 KEOPS complex kinase/ATPase Bud32 [Nitrososphaerota archaeon]